MASRGRGRGRKANLSFDVGSLGFGAGDALPTQTLQPPSTFPPLQQRPTPLASSEVDEYLLALSQEYRGSIKDSPFYLKAKTIKKDIVRYTDRYKQSNQSSDMQQWEPDWAYFPHELKPSVKRQSSNKCTHVNLDVKRKRKEEGVIDVVKKFDELRQKEITDQQMVGDENENEDEEGNEDDLEGEQNDNDDYDDDNDYNFDHYDDGGDNYGDDDAGIDEPTY